MIVQRTEESIVSGNEYAQVSCRSRILCLLLSLCITSLLVTLQQYLKPGEGPIVLVLAPTRELAVQIKEECDKFGASSEIKNTVVYGGVPKSKQVRDLRSGVEIIIATPGRLIDHLEQGNTNLYVLLIDSIQTFNVYPSFLISYSFVFVFLSTGNVLPTWCWMVRLRSVCHVYRFSSLHRYRAHDNP